MTANALHPIRPHRDAALIARAKRAFTTRRVPLRVGADAPAEGIDPVLVAPRAAREAGDLVLARVEAIGQHDGLQLHTGRRAALYEGDEVLACLGDRYAPDQFEGIAQVDDTGRCELLAAGGVVGTVRHRHVLMRPATRLQVLGCVADRQGRPLNVRSFAMADAATSGVGIPVVVVVGSSMNAGKTTACASAIHGLRRAGLRVGAAKVTGTGSFGDVQSYADAGACEVLDFTDAGYASTYRVDVARLEGVALRLIGALQARGCDVAVVEIADGLFQRETAGLIAADGLRAACSGALFAAADAMGAVAGVQRLRAAGWPVTGLTGRVTCSPLAASEAEAALAGCGIAVPVFTRAQLRAPEHACVLIDRARPAVLKAAA